MFYAFRVIAATIVLFVTLSSVSLAGIIAADNFNRADGATASDSLGASATGGYDWGEQFYTGTVDEDRAAINGNCLHIVDSSAQAVLMLSAPNAVIGSDMEFSLLDNGAAASSYHAGYVLRKTDRFGYPGAGTGNQGTIAVAMYASGVVRILEQTGTGGNTVLLLDNPFTAGAETDGLAFLSAGALPTTVNGLNFDTNGDGRLSTGETFSFGVTLDGANISVLINGEEVASTTLTNSGEVAGSNNYLAFYRANAGGSGTSGTVSYDNLVISTIPEPGTLALLGAGLVGLLCYAWRKRR